ncbi:MAG: sulfur carrier protein ThiS adenylyltransferase ThiF [Proteobacteria bacterium]|nr:sulfur carrier protein ThiS adenylyltransferase ThiF [Pseudomonadota bacterium]MBU1715735.1 sulfur carrier protein ThiS adenylyltransferase ThiF [Pseudomonadota bacterium]
MLMINEMPVDFRQGCRLVEFTANIMPGADVFIVNGFPVSSDILLQDGDNCWLIRRGEVPSHDEMEHLLYARHTPGVQAKVKLACVGIMGIGGLGSMVAVAMARIGVGRLLLADYDVVEPSNLNRQQYFVDQIGMKKTEAMKENLSRVNPYLTIELFDGELTEESIPEVFKDVDVLAECFDGAEMKAAGLRAALTRLKGKGYVGSSGVAGYADNNMIRTQKIYDKVYIVGDRESAAAPGQGLMAPRVGIAAHHQANQLLRILLGES